MSVAHNQLRIVRELWSRLQPLDRGVPARLQTLLGDPRFGSRDRRLYRELLFTALRHARLLSILPEAREGEPAAIWAAHLARACAATRETEAFRAAFTQAETLPSVDPSPALALVPEWFAAECEHGPGVPAPEAIATALLARAPVWTRLQTDAPAAVLAEWEARGWRAERHPTLPDAYRLPPETKLSACAAYLSGHYEIQDLGSQLILDALDLGASSPGPRWLDLCAGAGGKTLQLARLLGPGARIDATDVRSSALAELRLRAGRAGLGSRIKTADTSALRRDYDGVLVDAPCSGSGTWRRSPHLMACTGVADLAEAAATQGSILAEAGARVRPGGLLVYATCSIAHRENEAVAEAFLASPAGHEFTVAPTPRDHGFPRLAHGLFLAPGIQDNDGFYVAAFRRAD
ncbi:MAG: RsmB/NOP family class I SAM-dependent RNA methyltransferase [Opitutaceae bacterium]|jgi:16S rRNA (cytosine967-C5)-methyltransferase|nr:RsmB/NOP family class I SAM-dependent RNA methyltransferase [Opitutaceae bacterium]